MSTSPAELPAAKPSPEQPAATPAELWMQPKADEGEIASFIELISQPGDVREIRVLNTSKGTVSGYFNIHRTAAQTAARLSGKAPGVYMTMNPTLPDLLARANNRTADYAKNTTGNAHIARRDWLLIDIDPVRPAGISATDEELASARAVMTAVRDGLRAEGWPEPIITMSGNGYHLFYRVNLPNDEDSDVLVRAILEGVAHAHDIPGAKVDRAVHNAARIVKIPGTLTRKGDATADRPHRIARLEHVPTEIEPVPIEKLRAVAERAAAAKVGAQRSPRAPRYADNVGPAIDLADWLSTHHLAVRRTKPSQDGGTIYELAVCPFDAAHDRGEAVAVQHASGALSFKCHHDSCREKTWRDLRAMLEPAPERKRKRQRPDAEGADAPALPPGDGGGLTDIIVTNRQHAALVREGQEVLKDEPLYKFGGRPCFVRPDPGSGISQVIPATKEAIRLRISEKARFYRLSEKGALLGTIPPAHMPEGILADIDAPWPVIEHLTTAPLMTLTGRFQTVEGYDPDTRTYYAPTPGLEIPPVPDRPTPTDARAKAIELMTPFEDFPLVAAADRANFLAMLLQPFGRLLFTGNAPMAAVVAPTPGTGKSLLVEAGGSIFAGRVPGMSEGRDEDEWRKRLTAAVCRGSTVLFIDNVSRRLDAAPLAAMITMSIWEDRVLGESRIVSLPVPSLIVVTGNNLTFSNEIARRVMVINLDAREERPYLRTGFRIPNLIEYVRQNRGRLIGAALTILRAWVVAGRPSGAYHLGSFESWASTMGGILDVAGVRGFLGNQQEVFERGDTEGRQWRAFVTHWWQTFGMTEKTAGQLYDACKDTDVLAGIVNGDGTDRTLSIRLGKALMRVRDRVFVGKRITYCGEGRTGSALWRLSTDPTPSRITETPSDTAQPAGCGADILQTSCTTSCTDYPHGYSDSEGLQNVAECFPTPHARETDLSQGTRDDEHDAHVFYGVGEQKHSATSCTIERNRAVIEEDAAGCAAGSLQDVPPAFCIPSDAPEESGPFEGGYL